VPPTAFKELMELCHALEATTKRNEKITLIAGFLRRLDPGEVSPAVLLLAGTIFPESDGRSLEVGWSTMRRLLSGGAQTPLFRRPLTIMHVHGTLTEIAEAAGPRSRAVKERLMEGLVGQGDGHDVDVLARIVFGEMRIGAGEGVIMAGIAEAAGVSLKVVRRALMMTGDLGKVANVALTRGEEGLKDISVSLFVPLKPMLAAMAEGVSEALEGHGGRTAFEYKYDGARIQIHRQGGETRVFSRRLSDVTGSIPDIVELVERCIPADDVILEGEVIAIGETGRPLPFQDLMRRFTRVKDVEEMAERIPLRLHLFDVLYHDGQLLIDQPYERRWGLLERLVPRDLLAVRIVTESPEEAKGLLEEALEAGHEGLMAKRLDSAYTPGARGKRWFKIKSSETLDLVVAAADWGSGRRRGWLSNYHLAARRGDEYLGIGKTFKGLTDEEFTWMTGRLQELKDYETDYTVHVHPSLVVEVAFNEIQRSPHYRSGYALRFARVTRIRTDKGPGDADTLTRVRELYERQFRYKDRIDL